MAALENGLVRLSQIEGDLNSCCAVRRLHPPRRSCKRDALCAAAAILFLFAVRAVDRGVCRISVLDAACCYPLSTIAIFLGTDSTRSFYFAVQQLSVSGGVTKSLAQELPVSLARNIEFLKHLPKLQGFNALEGLGRGVRRGLRSPLVETRGFGANPGDLRMFSYVPDNLQPAPGLVVVLHGCGQTAAGYDLGAGWSTLAKHYGFALLMPEQQPANNAQGCFNWFNPEDTARGHGEACSIRQMIARMVGDHQIDPHRIFITGLSAGGAMTSVMLATYPEVFAAGAIIAGLPFGVATNVREALNGMFQSRPHPASELGDLVRSASKHRGPWPKVSVWHGSADRTVNPANADEIVKQWLDVHQLPSAPMSAGTVDGYPRQIWWNADGETTVESYTITDMAHGTPLGTADNDERYGTQGAFLIEAGISSSYHIANFFGLTEWIRQPKDAAKESAKELATTSSTVASKRPVKKVPVTSPAPLAAPDISAVLWPLASFNRRTEPPRQARRGIDVGGVITRALTAAGLMK
jgi:poly(hydroxyalkanoate) depolymerase family esterase